MNNKLSRDLVCIHISTVIIGRVCMHSVNSNEGLQYINTNSRTVVLQLNKFFDNLLSKIVNCYRKDNLGALIFFDLHDTQVMESHRANARSDTYLFSSAFPRFLSNILYFMFYRLP